MNDNPRSVPERKTDRRGLLALIGAGGAATMAALLGRSNGARAATGESLILGQANTADAPTILEKTGEVSDWTHALEVQHLGGGSPQAIAIAGVSDGGYGVVGASPSGVGVHGKSEGGAGVSGGSANGPGGWFESQSGVGVHGYSPNHPGVHGHSESGSGVEGQSGTGPGVLGRSNSGSGVEGRTQTGFGVVGIAEGVNEGWGPVGVIGAAFGEGSVGVHGKSNGSAGVDGRGEGGAPGVVGEGLGDGAGVRAEHRSSEEPYDLDGGLALEVVGKARFSTCGAGTVPAGDNSVFVANGAVMAVSHISVTLTGNPGQRQLRWVERVPGSGFTVHLTTGGPKPATDFTYLIVEPAV